MEGIILFIKEFEFNTMKSLKVNNILLTEP